MPIIDDLRKGQFFACLDTSQQERVATRAVRVRLAAGESLFQQGDKAERFYYVISGLIKLYRISPAGNEKVVEVVSAGSTFAEALMFLYRPYYPVGAEALQPSELISVDAADFSDMLRGSVETCFILLGDLSQRLRGLIREIDNLSLHTAVCRVAGYLLANAPEGQDELVLDVPKQTIASRLSVKPETLSRIIKNLCDLKVIEMHGNRVTLHDREQLQGMADACAVAQDSLKDTFLYPCPPHYVPNSVATPGPQHVKFTARTK
ncbi:MAG: Crp/Fnr family transcriptional regulator [Gammaproteobacteria bacterium]|nr:Crp/Fnr family transcriptional regulator [Gammaproteobacteria bacterium]